METKLKRKQDLQLLYYRYKDTPLFAASISILLILVAIILIIKVIIPQLQNWFSIRDEVSAARERIQVLTENQLYLSSINPSDLEENFKVAAAALPFEKDFPGVLTAIGASTIATGAILDDYSFQVGNLSTKSAELKEENSLSVELSIEGSLDVVDAFLDEIYRKVPMAEVVEVDYNEGSASIGLLFYYEILPGKVQVTYTKPLTPLSSDNIQVLDELEEWMLSSQSIGSSGEPVPSTSSGTLSPF